MVRAIELTLNSADDDFVLDHLVLRLVGHLLGSDDLRRRACIACSLSILPFEIEYVVLDRGKRVVIRDIEACRLFRCLAVA